MNPLRRIENMAEYGFADLGLEESQNMHSDALELMEEIEQLQTENDKVKARNLDLDDALSLAHTELTEIPDWPDTEHQHFVSETVEQALKGGESNE